MNTYTILFLLFLAIITLQLIVTYQFTYAKYFSTRALVRNVSIGIAVYFAVTTQKYYLLLIPIFVEIVIELLKLKGIYIDKYVATIYQFSDLFRELNINDNIYSNLSEANYDNVLGFSTTDYSQENIKKVLDWSIHIYNKSYNEKNELLTDMNGKEHEATALKKLTDNGKFKYICEKCEIKPGMRILEIGFGEGDFMKYIHENYGIKPIGVNISSEQVNLIKEMGFEAFAMDGWQMTPEKIGTFDLILQCGNCEYIRCVGESSEKYYKYASVIKPLLNSNGKYFVTCIHENKHFNEFNFTWFDYLKCYLLWSANDGGYPRSKIDMSKYVEKAGLKNIYQEDRTIDYWISYVIWMSYFRCRKEKKCMNTMSMEGLSKALFKTIAGPYYLHAYLCYTPNNYYYWIPWMWQFVPQERNGKLDFPVTLEYILFQKE
jgi:cyclopropane fatty-acyl-phospholipid synthase-like methyltransferase